MAVDSKYYHVEINQNEKLINKKDKYIAMMSYEDFINSNLVKLNNETPLRKDNNQTSSIIINYKDYTYEPIEFKGEWLKLKSIKEIDGVEVVGWVKWKNNNNILIEIAYII